MQQLGLGLELRVDTAEETCALVAFTKVAAAWPTAVTNAPQVLTSPPVAARQGSVNKQRALLCASLEAGSWKVVPECHHQWKPMLQRQGAEDAHL